MRYYVWSVRGAYVVTWCDDLQAAIRAADQGGHERKVYAGDLNGPVVYTTPSQP